MCSTYRTNQTNIASGFAGGFSGVALRSENLKIEYKHDVARECPDKSCATFPTPQPTLILSLQHMRPFVKWCHSIAATLIGDDSNA